MTRAGKTPSSAVKIDSVKPNGTELASNRRREKIPPKAESNLARDAILAVLFVLTLPTIIIPVGIIVYLNLSNKEKEVTSKKARDKWGIGNQLSDDWACPPDVAVGA